MHERYEKFFKEIESCDGLGVPPIYRENAEEYANAIFDRIETLIKEEKSC